MARLHLGQGTLSTRLPFQDRMVGVSTLNLQKKCILVAEKSCYLQEQSSKLFFSLREFLFSLIKLFFFSIWTVKTSLRSVLTTIQISKKKNLIAENKNSLSEKKLRLRALFFQSNVFPATRNIYSYYLLSFHSQWANIVQTLLCHANSAKGKSSISHLKGLKISFHL